MVGLDAAHVEAKARPDDPDIANDTALDQLDQFDGLRMNAVHEGFAGEPARFPRLMKDGFRIKGAEADWLFDEDMLAGAERLDSPLGVSRMRCRNVDGIHFRIVQQSLVATDDACVWKMIGKAGPVRIARAMATSLPVREWAMLSAKVRAMVPGPMMPQRIDVVSFMDMSSLDWCSSTGRVAEPDVDYRSRLPSLSNRKAWLDGCDGEQVAVGFIAGFFAFDDDLFTARHVRVDVAGIAEMFATSTLMVRSASPWPALTKCSGRMPSVTRSPLPPRGLSTGSVTRTLPWFKSVIVTLWSVASIISALMKFILGEPTKPATN